MDRPFAPITQQHPLRDGGYPAYLPFSPRPVGPEDYYTSQNLQIAEDWVHAAACILAHGRTEDFLQLADEITARLLWQVPYVNSGRHQAGQFANHLQLMAVFAHNCAIACLRLGQSGQARAQWVLSRDSLRGWARDLDKDVPLSDSTSSLAYAEACLARHTDTLVTESNRLKQFLDENHPG